MAKNMWTTDDPGEVRFLPFPVQYQLLGGEAKNLVPHELIQIAEDTLLSALDVPAELYRNTLSVEGAPLALTLFENKWRWFRNELERFLLWAANKLTPKLGWSPVKLALMPLKINADISRATLAVQLAAQGSIGWETALKTLGFNYLEEQKSIIDTQMIIMELQQKAEQKGMLQGMLQNVTMSQNPAAAGQPPPPPEAAGAGGGVPPMGGDPGMSPQGQGLMGAMGAGMEMSDYEKLSPTDLVAMAQQFAQQIKQSELQGMRQQTMSKLRSELPAPVYAAVREELRKIDRDQRNEGYAALNQQGGGQPM